MKKGNSGCFKNHFMFFCVFHCVQTQYQRTCKLTKNGGYPAGATGGIAPRGPAAGGSTGNPEEKMPRAFRFKPGIKLACCCCRGNKQIVVKRGELQNRF